MLLIRLRCKDLHHQKDGNKEKNGGTEKAQYSQEQSRQNRPGTHPIAMALNNMFVTGWLRLVGFSKLQVSFVKEISKEMIRCKRDLSGA